MQPGLDAVALAIVWAIVRLRQTVIAGFQEEVL